MSADSESAHAKNVHACTMPVGSTPADTFPPFDAAAIVLADKMTGLKSSGLTTSLAAWERRRRPRAADVRGWQPTEK